jgi:NAD(P)-dependent dehydrogenase (short-subunit alcohol dehydrogenase family)
MTKQLDAKVAVVTGGASGIGLACALALAAEGAAVVVADIAEDGARVVAEQIKAAGGRAHAVRVDLADPTLIRAMIDTCVAEFGRLDFLHNNAAATQLAAVGDSGVADMDLAVWERTLQVNLTGTMLATQIALPHLIASGDGRIVNMSSGASLRGDLGHTAYAVSKGGINTLTQYTAAQYGKVGIRCNAIAPGLVVTPASSGNFAGPLGDLMLRHHLTPRLGNPEDIAAMVVFLCSPGGGFITGQVLNVDGGLDSHLPYVADLVALQTK